MGAGSWDGYPHVRSQIATGTAENTDLAAAILPSLSDLLRQA
jgi:hypothetical protein